jgi:hypothetical protein
MNDDVHLLFEEWCKGHMVDHIVQPAPAQETWSMLHGVAWAGRPDADGLLLAWVSLAACPWDPDWVGLTLPVGPRHLKLHRLHAIIWISTWLQKQLQEEGSGAWPPMSNDMSHSLRFNHRYLVLCGHLKFVTGSLLCVTMFFLFPRHLPVGWCQWRTFSF